MTNNDAARRRGSVKTTDRVMFGGGDSSTVSGGLGCKRQTSGRLTTSGSAALKISIKPVSAPLELPEKFKHDMWRRLAEAVHAVYHQEAVAFPLEELYKAVNDLCKIREGDYLYTKLHELLDRFIGDSIAAFESTKAIGHQFLVELAQLWEVKCREMSMVRAIFTTLDREVMLQSTKQCLADVGINLFCAHLDKHASIRTKCIESLVEQIRLEREGELVDRMLLKKLIAMLSTLRCYDRFETPFLHATNAFYAEEAKAAEGKDQDIKAYVNLVKRRLAEEDERLDAYLCGAKTRTSLLLVAEKQLVAGRAPEILSGGFEYLMANKCLPELTLLYTHLSLPNVSKLGLLRKAFSDYVRAHGASIIASDEGPATVIPNLLEYKKELDTVVTTAFAGTTDFVHALRDACEAALNKHGNKPAEMLAKFVDSKMKVGARETDDNMEPLLDACLDLFRLIQAKDAFEAFYNKDFAKRLLLGRSASPDTEKSFIAKLKADCGPSFTQKMEGMLKDMDSSKEIFNQYAAADVPKHDFGFHVLMLTQAHWPSYQSWQVRLPPNLDAALNGFQQWYLKANSGRKLTWQPCLCTCVVKATLPKWRKELVVSLLQALILLAFNSEEEITFSRIQDLVGTKDQDVTRAMQALVFSQGRVLKRTSKGSKQIAATDTFRVNEDFQHKSFRVKINTAQMKETEEEQQTTNEKVFQDRVYSVDACIVRTMKARKTLAHADLMSTVMQQLKFPVQPSDLKKRIESMIEREYLARDDDKQNVYHYIA